MKKCGIMTFHRAINYGGVLQAYALQKTLEKMDVECDVIDYKCGYIENIYRPRKLFDKLLIKRIISALLRNGTLFFNNKGFAKFIRENIKTSKAYKNTDELQRANSSYDFFITGSDQVWSPTCAGFDGGYFLDFVDDAHKKNSYAASFGVSEIPDKLKDEYKKRIEDFENISVREACGGDIVKDLTGKDVTVVPDPTLLLTKDEWSGFVRPYEKGRYIFVYMISESKEILDIARKLSKERGMPVLYVNDRLYKAKGVTNLRKVNPDEWISLIANAECIITNSFHGVAFSINFKKDFYVKYLDINVKANNRISDILKKFSLEDRLIGSFEDIKSVMPLNYLEIDKVLEDEREIAVEYLKNLTER